MTLSAEQSAFVVEQVAALRDFAIRLLQSGFHDGGEEAANNVLTRACGSRALGVFRSGDAGNPISDGNHGNLLSQTMRQQTAFEFASVLQCNIARFANATTA
ncbi:MAG TPA: hypothetical protein VJ800_10895 [Pseudolabrys sp.]|nr:hypothetical protein [Pseudolabrys sp.]